MMFSVAQESLAQAQGRMIEEVIVTAQRAEESIQDVPIAVTALTGDMLEERGVLTSSDLQMSAPSVTFTPTNFGGYSFSIRGIGNLVIGGESGVSTHINEIPVASQLNAVEFFDMERVEILRGPQGTLFGRNATGGAVNFVTRKPDFDAVNGFIDLEAGDYDNRRLKGALNIPITNTFALRAAGMLLTRDGYIENTAYQQVADNGVGAGVDTISGINDDLDGRDIETFRITGEWDISDRANLWVMYSYFNEDDDRARITNQICKTNTVPTLGCLTDEVAFESPHAYTGTGGIIFGLGAGAYSTFSPQVTQKYEAGPDDRGFRKMHTDFEPVYQEDEDLVAFGLTYELDNASFSLQGAYQEREWLYQQDYAMDTGNLLFDGSIPFPVSAPAGGAGDEWRDGPCNYNDGTSGAQTPGVPTGGCTLQGVDTTVMYSYDQADGNTEYWTIEGKVASRLDGKFNFVLGTNAYEGEGYGDYYVISNSLDAAGAYPGFFNNSDDPARPAISEGWAVFGEAYYDVTERMKFTLGLRYNEDTREAYGANVLFNSFDLNGALGGALGEATYVRTTLQSFLFAGAPLGAQSALAELYGVTQAQIDAANATAPVSAERIALAAAIPPVPQAGEARFLTGSPTEFKFTEWSGRVGFDWFVSDDSMVYAFYSRGYKPGGLNPAIPVDFQSTSRFSFDPEQIDAFEIGTKNRFLDGSMVLNGAIYYYDYGGLQVTRIVNNSSINDNIGAEIYGIEAEMSWRPNAIPRLGLDASYSYTNANVVDSLSIDPTNRTASNPDWITLNNTDTGANTGVNFVAPEDGLAALALTCGVPIPGLTYPDGLPALWSRNCLDANGITTSDGLETDLDGNALPNTPKHNVKLGLDYTWDVPAIAGAITLRWDYYWQSKSEAREFNVPADEIDSWEQHNASLIYLSSDGHWQVRAFVRNLTDEDNVTGHYLTSDTSGFYRNYFLTEPRIYGASVRYDFGL